MTRLLLVSCLTCLVSALSAAGALAARHHQPKPRPRPKLSYSTGAYTGTVALPAPAVVPGTISFAVSRGSVTTVNVKLAELCGGAIWAVVGDAPQSLTIPVAPGGSFSYDETVLGDHLTLQGRLKGNQATGTVFDSLTTGTLVCTMSGAATFTAQH